MLIFVVALCLELFLETAVLTIIGGYSSLQHLQ